MDVADVLEARKAKAEREYERNSLAGQVNGGFHDASRQSAQSINERLDKGIKINNLPEPSRQNVTIGLHGLEHLEVDAVTLEVKSATIEGLAALISTMIDKMDQLVARVENIKLITPEVNVPTPQVTVQPTEVHVPEPKVTVNVPAPQVTLRPNITVQAPKQAPQTNVVTSKTPTVRIVQEKELYREGFLDGVEEIYSDGTKHTETGWSTGKIKHVYA